MVRNNLLQPDAKELAPGYPAVDDKQKLIKCCLCKIKCESEYCAYARWDERNGREGEWKYTFVTFIIT